MSSVIKAIDMLTYALAAIAAVAVVGLMVHVTVDVVMRAFFNAPPTGTIIFVSNYYMILVVCLPLALVERNDAHISVDVLTERLPAGIRRHLYSWTFLFAAAVFGIVAWSSWQEAITQYKLDRFVIEGGIRFTTWYGYFAVPFGYGFAGLWAVLKFIRYLLGQDRTPLHPPQDEIEKVIYD